MRFNNKFGSRPTANEYPRGKSKQARTPTRRHTDTYIGRACTSTCVTCDYFAEAPLPTQSRHTPHNFHKLNKEWHFRKGRQNHAPREYYIVVVSSQQLHVWFPGAHTSESRRGPPSAVEHDNTNVVEQTTTNKSTGTPAHTSTRAPFKRSLAQSWRAPRAQTVSPSSP